MDLLTMTKAELERLRILQEVQRGFRRQRDAATELGVSERQLRRLLRGLEAHGGRSAEGARGVTIGRGWSDARRR